MTDEERRLIAAEKAVIALATTMQPEHVEAALLYLKREAELAVGDELATILQAVQLLADGMENWETFRNGLLRG